MQKTHGRRALDGCLDANVRAVHAEQLQRITIRSPCLDGRFIATASHNDNHHRPRGTSLRSINVHRKLSELVSDMSRRTPSGGNCWEKVQTGQQPGYVQPSPYSVTRQVQPHLLGWRSHENQPKMFLRPEAGGCMNGSLCFLVMYDDGLIREKILSEIHRHQTSSAWTRKRLPHRPEAAPQLHSRKTEMQGRPVSSMHGRPF